MSLDPNTPVWQLTVGQFTELMTSLQPKSIEQQSQEEIYLTTNEVVSYMKISKSTLFRWKKDLYLPFEKKGGILRFKKSEVDKILNKK